MITSSDVITVQMPLSKQALGMAQKPRWRGRLRDIQARCPGGTSLKLSKELSTVEISGTAEGVQVAQRLVEERLGPVKELSAAVWHELHRTRKGFGGLNLIHKLTGCRLHLQRDTSQVRLFGTAPCVAKASALLDRLEEMCTEERVTGPAHQLDQNMLDKIACETCVTLWIAGSELYLMGFKAAIEDALAEIKRLISFPDLIPRDMADAPKTAREVFLLAPLIRFAPNVPCPRQDSPPNLPKVGGSDASTGVCEAVNRVNNAPYSDQLNQYQSPWPMMSTEQGGSTLPLGQRSDFTVPFDCHAMLCRRY